MTGELAKLQNGFDQKEQAGGHRTDPPSSTTYSSVVSRESVRLSFLVAALNGLDVTCHHE